MALEIALPSLVFVRILQEFSPETFPDWWTKPLWWLLFMGLVAVFTYTFSFISKPETRNEFRISLFYQNAIFFPLAILSGMFGDSSSYLVYLYLFTPFYPAFFFNTYHIFFKQKIRSLNWKRIFNNVLIATLLGLVLVLVNFVIFVPGFVVQIFILLGAMALPLIMIIIGGNIYLDYQKKRRLYIGELIKFVIIKNIVFPLVLLAVIIVLQPAYHIALIFMPQAAIPPVSSIPIFTKRAGGNHGIVNQFVVASFIASLLTIPIMISLFSYFWFVSSDGQESQAIGNNPRSINIRQIRQVSGTTVDPPFSMILSADLLISLRTL
ncbi:MAG: AEC family transporter [Candidatus Thermoplasmatota archaeon]|nr:AEC family transporter [Candidatus Thermoplasmatota archaeon]MBU1941103.1 AEC family transporter [Candidatus Thermoplasmatota archaeon]